MAHEQRRQAWPAVRAGQHHSPPEPSCSGTARFMEPGTPTCAAETSSQVQQCSTAPRHSLRTGTLLLGEGSASHGHWVSFRCSHLLTRLPHSKQSKTQANRRKHGKDSQKDKPSEPVQAKCHKHEANVPSYVVQPAGAAASLVAHRVSVQSLASPLLIQLLLVYLGRQWEKQALTALSPHGI